MPIKVARVQGCGAWAPFVVGLKLRHLHMLLLLLENLVDQGLSFAFGFAVGFRQLGWADGCSSAACSSTPELPATGGRAPVCLVLALRFPVKADCIRPSILGVAEVGQSWLQDLLCRSRAIRGFEQPYRAPFTAAKRGPARSGSSLLGSSPYQQCAGSAHPAAGRAP